MADSRQSAEPSVPAVVRGVTRKTALLCAVGAAGGFVLRLMFWPGLPVWAVPAGVVFGCALGVVNFRWLAYAVERVYLRKGSPGVVSNIAAVVINILKLSAIFAVLYIVIKGNFVNIFGLVAGISLCFAAILWQGLNVLAGGGEGENPGK